MVSSADLPASIEQLRVPAALRPTVTAIIAAADAVCERHLDGEYGELCRRLVGRLASERPSPLARGEPRIWAAGVIYTVGSLNFLFDRSQVPHMRADELAAGLGVVKSTMANKAARIRKILDLSWFEPELMRRSMLAASAHVARRGERDPRRCALAAPRATGRGAPARADPRSRPSLGRITAAPEPLIARLTLHSCGDEDQLAG